MALGRYRQLLRVRPPSTKITYDVELEGALVKKTLPVTFGLFGWPENKVETEQSFQLKNIKFKQLDFDFQKLLTELVNIEDLKNSQLYEMIYASALGAYEGELYSAIFIRGIGDLHQQEIVKLSELASMCHVAFIFNHEGESDADVHLLEHLCQKIEMRGWFYESDYNAPSLEIIHGSKDKDRELSGLILSLCASRYVHYVLAIICDKDSDVKNESNLQDYLNNWISQYVLLDETTSEEISASYPLQAARIEIKSGSLSGDSFLVSMDLRFRFGFSDEPEVKLSFQV